MLLLKKSVFVNGGQITISGSKSETNRLLVLQALFPRIIITNESDSDDSVVLKQLLRNSAYEKNVSHCGTAMRFLTAFFAAKPGSIILLTGSDSMKTRPIHLLVDALRSLGASIDYVGKEGFAPLKICGTVLKGGSVNLDASVSSQFISALMLVAPKFPEGLEINLTSSPTSKPYLMLTMNIMQRIGIAVTFKDSVIKIPYLPELPACTYEVEPDWSSASYFYSLLALAEVGSSLTLLSFRKDSLQGDARAADLFTFFGVETFFQKNKIILKKTSHSQKEIKLDLNDMPDLAQTIAVTCLGLSIDCHLTGLGTLPIKETNRLLALQTELTKFGAKVQISANSLQFSAVPILTDGVVVETYNDHRMALSFAPLCLKTSLSIANPAVVSKSFPAFWQLLKQVLQ